MSSAWSDGVLLLALTTVAGKLTVHTQTAYRKIKLLQDSKKLSFRENPEAGKARKPEISRTLPIFLYYYAFHQNVGPLPIAKS